MHKAKSGEDGSVVILDEPFLAKRVFREIKLLSHFNHENILGLISVMSEPASPEPLSKLYMVMECMDTDLSQIIRDPSVDITDEHIQYFMFQILHGLKCLHDARVIHRYAHTSYWFCAISRQRKDRCLYGFVPPLAPHDCTRIFSHHTHAQGPAPW